MASGCCRGVGGGSTASSGMDVLYPADIEPPIAHPTVPDTSLDIKTTNNSSYSSQRGPVGLVGSVLQPTRCCATQHTHSD